MASPGASIEPFAGRRDSAITKPKVNTTSRLPLKGTSGPGKAAEASAMPRIKAVESHKTPAALKAHNTVTSSAGKGKDSAPRPTRRQNSSTRISILPRSARGGLTQASSALSLPNETAATVNTPTPSLISGSSASTQDSPETNVLRRKPSFINATTSQTRRKAMLQQHEQRLPNAQPYKDPYFDSTSASSTVTEFEDVRDTDAEMDYVSELAAKGSIGSYEVVQPPTFVPPPSITPSTRYSASPGAFSYATTPTSMSSLSSQITTSPYGRSTLPRVCPADAVGTSHQHNNKTTTRRRSGSQSETGGYISPLKSSIPSPLSNAVRDNNSLGSPTVYSQVDGEPTDLVLSRTSNTGRTGMLTEQQEHLATSHGPRNILRLPPPELAHLMGSSDSLAGSKEMAPTRPNRDGIPSLADRGVPSVVESHIPRLQSPFHAQDRTTVSSQDSDSNSTAPGGRSIDPLHIKKQIQPRAQKRDLDRSQILASSNLPLAQGKAPVKENHSRKGSRFGFFSRRPKPEPLLPKDDPSKMLKKGPIAGTGHEGYGRYASRRRSGNIAIAKPELTPPLPSSTSADNILTKRRSISSDKSSPGVDQFFPGRLAPAPIRGQRNTTIRQFGTNEIAPSGSSQSTEALSPLESSIGSPKTYRTSNSSLDGSTQGFIVRSVPIVNQIVQGSPSIDTSDSEASSRVTRHPVRKGIFSSRSSRKSDAQRSRNAIASSSSSTLANENGPGLAVSLRSAKASTMVDNKSLMSSKKSNRTLLRKTPPAPKSSQNWNLFQRKQSPKSSSVEDFPAPIAPEVPFRSMAHYAIMDSHSQINLKDLDDIMLEAEAAQRDEDLAYNHSTSSSLRQHSPSLFSSSDLLQSPRTLTALPRMTSNSSTSNLNPSQPQTNDDAKPTRARNEIQLETYADNDAGKRTSRLAPVGRIPKVISTSERTGPFHNKSFSRPFVNRFHASDLSSEIVTHSSINEPMTKYTDQMVDKDPIDTSTEPQFLSFPKRTNSDLSYSSSSGTMYLHAATAIVPEAGAPLSEDEVWQEYDDLIDGILSSKPSVSGRNHIINSQPSAAETESFRKLTENIVDRQREQVLYNKRRPGKDRMLTYNQQPFPLAAKSFDHHPRKQPSVLPTVSSLVPPFSPPTLPESEYHSKNGTLSNPVSGIPRRSKSPKSARRSTVSTHSRLSFLPVLGNQDSFWGQQAEMLESSKPSNPRPVSSANLRFGALMVSKWLTFGRVLFSPAHIELVQKTSGRVLIIDGLGKDWSHWCAITYANADVYHLGPPTSDSMKRGFGGFKSLPNHRYISHLDFNAPFPFPKGFFATVVFRFPVVTSEATYRSIVSQCKRVLRPGGHIEISMLDLDLNNMGNRTRRAVRTVKSRIQETDSSISLQPASDTMLRLLGRRGFENLNCCTVGVPAAGVISRSRENSFDKTDKDLTDLVKDDSREGDEGITKMVARVGRWWYTNCYEKLALPPGDHTDSIWNDPALLKECESWQTNLKLLICYAQKPTIVVRRTVSL